MSTTRKPTPAPRPNPRLDDYPLAASRNAAPLVQSEKDFQRQVLSLAKLHHWAHYHSWRSDHSPSGFPDLVLVRPPRILFVEVKREDGMVTSAQQHWLQVLGACRGCETAVWRPSDWMLIEATLA